MMSPAVSPRQLQSTGLRFCYDVLPDVSRTFALTIPVLRAPLADSVCVAYLLCRIADTIEDCSAVEPAQRQLLYRRFAELVAEPTRASSASLAPLTQSWPAEVAAYQELMAGTGEVLSAFAQLPPAHREAINGCVQEMIAGMAAMTHPEPEAGMAWVCDSLEHLEQYCHFVAGTVGLMLTRLFDHELGGGFATAERLEDGRRFGLGLQLTNILKDHVADRERGTSFIPRAWTDSSQTITRQKLGFLVQRTLAHLDVAQDYTLAIPAARDDMRLFCLWALWMAVPTLREVARRRGPRPKISRLEVAELTAHSRARVRDDAGLRLRYTELRRQVAGALRELGTVAEPS